MRKHILITAVSVVFLAFGCVFFSCSNSRTGNRELNQPVKIIFDTDIGGDWDDVGALAVLHHYANTNEAEILAVGVSAVGYTAEWGPSCIDAINTYFNRPEIPIGICSSGIDYPTSPYNRQISEEFPFKLDTVFNAAKLYRKLLSQQPDTSVVIVTVGYFDNIAELLKTSSCNYSELSGVDLVNKKVKRWVCMGGIFPEGGTECNATSAPIATKFAIDNWPRPILFSGFEIGNKIETGKKLALLPKSNPIRRAYEISGGLNTSFDQTAIVAAVKDPELYWEVVGNGYCSMSTDWKTGNKWHSSPDKGHAYLKEKVPPEDLEVLIDSLMMAMPK